MLPSESPIPEGFPVVGCPTCVGARYRLLPTDGLVYACAQGHETGVEELQRLLNQSRTRRDDARMEAERQAAIGRFWDKIVPPETPGAIDVQETQKSLEVLVSGTPAVVTAEWDRLAAEQGGPILPGGTGECWQCMYCGWQLLDPQLDLATAVCLCGVGAGRWGVGNIRLPHAEAGS